MARSGRIAASYILDWVVVVCFAGAGAALTYIPGFHRPFSLTNDDYAYPTKANIVSLPVVAIISLAGPAAVIFAVNLCAALLSRSGASRPGSSFGLRGRLAAMAWETHAGWLGLCTGLAVTLFVTAGLKDMVGKPRPDMLARCQPDLINIEKYIVGGLGMTLDSEAPPFVTSAICQQSDKRLLDDGFAAFPSGHSSFNSAGMIYLTLWLCARWSLAIPILGRSALQSGPRERKSSQSGISRSAPPLWQVALAFTPFFVALFVCSSRYADFHHAGIDIIAGALIGGLFGWASFRLYHLPIRRSGRRFAWEPRTERNAFVAHHNNEGTSLDEEQGRRPMSTELYQLHIDNPARTDTGGYCQPIL